MLGGFLPPVVFTITSNATQAIAGFSKVNAQLKLMEAQAAKTSKSMLALSKATAVATAAAKAFGIVMVAFAGYGVKEVMQLEQAYARLGQSLASVGLSTAQNREVLANTAQGMEALGFDAAKASDALSLLIQTTKDVDASQKLLTISADLARARQMDLATAARLLGRAQAGNNRVFTMFGITVDKTKSKTEATAEAMEKLATVLKGQAEAYTKTFAGQLEVLGKQIENVAEGIGAALLPYLMKFLNILQRLFGWLNRHREVLAGVAFVIGTVLVAALTLMIRKMTIAIGQWVILNSKMLIIIAVIMAVASSIVYLWNKFEGFRKTVVEIGKVFVLFGEVVVGVFQIILNAFLLVNRAVANLQIGMGKLFNNKEMERGGKEMLTWIDDTNKKIYDFGSQLTGVRKKLDSVGDVKIDLSKFKLPALEIPKFANGNTFGEEIASDVKKGLAQAKMEIKSFNADLKTQFSQMGAMWDNIISRDFQKDIYAKIGDPIDEIIYNAQTAINAYASASDKYATATKNLKQYQEEYKAAVKGGNEELISAAKEALGRAEQATQGVYDDMGEALRDVGKYQQEMINKVAQLYEEINALEKERTQTLAAAKMQRLEIEDEYLTEVKKLRKDYDADVLTAETDAAIRRAEILKQSIDQIRGVFKTATSRTLGDIYQGLTFEGRYIAGGTPEKIIAALGLQAGKAEKLAQNAATLAGLGFTQTFIEEVISQGPDLGNSLASTIINSTPESIQQMQEYWSRLQNVTSHGVDTLATQLNAGMNLATEELMAQMAQVDIDLANTLKTLQDRLTENLSAAFITYSNSLDAVNIRTNQQIAAIDDQIVQLNLKINMLKSSLAALAALGAPGTANAAVNVMPTITTSEEEGVATSCASGRGRFKVTKYDGVVTSRTLIACIEKSMVPGGDVITGAGSPAEIPSGVTATTQVNKATSAYLGLLSANTLEDINKGVASAVAANVSASQIGSAMSSALQTSPDIASIGGLAGAASSARYTGQAIQWYQQTQKTNPITVNITANTNASASSIADSVAWTIRTSSDTQYYTGGSGGQTDMRAV